ncbi:MAG: pilus assembly protein TadG-related protein [Actinomycetota bacterium]|nr:pilus assembly protein TadG-related protein [Actinomycetota bacterium]
MTFLRRNEHGQAIVLSVLALVVLFGACAIAVDVGAWLREKRQLQAAADSAALAAAQVLPGSTTSADTLAKQYATKNGRTAKTVTFSSATVSNDTVQVTVETDNAGFFSGVLGITTTKITRAASARSSAPAQLSIVAPITIGSDNPQLKCGAPCYGQEINLVALPTGSYDGNFTNFQLIDLSKNGGNVSPAQVAEWLRRGYNGYLSPGQYPGTASTTFNSPEFKQAMDDMKGKEIVVFVHSSANGGEGAPGALYQEVGWGAFHITKYTGTSSMGTLTGYFTSVNMNGVPSSDPNQKTWGVRTINLVS